MTQILLLEADKETEDKLRWSVNREDLVFELYISKNHVPKPRPKRIRVHIGDVGGTKSLPQRSNMADQGGESPMVTLVKRAKDLGDKVQFAPQGRKSSWKVGRVYIQKDLLPSRDVEIVRIEVEWDYSAGTWGDR